MVSQQRPSQAVILALTAVVSGNGLSYNKFDGHDWNGLLPDLPPEFAALSLKRNPASSSPTYSFRKLTTDAQRIAARHPSPRSRRRLS